MSDLFRPPRTWRNFSLVIICLFTFLTIGPLIWLFYSSFKPHADIVRNIFALPETFYLGNYIGAWKKAKLGLAILNSIFYSVIATGLTTVFALSAGYALAKFRYFFSKIMYGFFAMGMLITIHSVLIPLFILETRINIDDTRIGVLLPYIAFGLPLLVYLATAYIKGMPDSIEEAARIDGAGYLTIFTKVIAPMCIPVVTTMIIFSFLTNWNEFALVYILTSKAELRSLPVGINAFAGGRSRDYGLQYAALVIGTLPMILFYIFFRKQLARGFASGALKE